jgi:uridine phosphorylase
LTGRRRLAADPEILAGLQAVASDGPVSVGPIVSTDLFYDAEDRIDGWIAAGALAVEMQAATLFALAARRGVQAGCAAIVSSRLVGTAGRIDGAELDEAERRLGALAAGALACV